MPRQDAYNQWLKEDLGQLIETLKLSDLQKYLLRARWLEQIMWMEARANAVRNWYYRLRLTLIIGGVIIPALISLNTPAVIGDISDGVAAAISWTAPSAFLLVALSAAVEQFFNYGDRWCHYRRMAETLKVEAWQFFQVSGPYRRFRSHADAYRGFFK